MSKVLFIAFAVAIIYLFFRIRRLKKYLDIAIDDINKKLEYMSEDFSKQKQQS